MGIIGSSMVNIYIYIYIYLFHRLIYFIIDPFNSPSYLVCFAVGDFTEVDDGEVNGIPIKV
jgi:aminopeptidase N